MSREAGKKGKFGAVFTKLRAGKGKRTPILVTMTGEDFKLLLNLGSKASEFIASPNTVQEQAGPGTMVAKEVSLASA